MHNPIRKGSLEFDAIVGVTVNYKRLAMTSYGKLQHVKTSQSLNVQMSHRCLNQGMHRIIWSLIKGVSGRVYNNDMRKAHGIAWNISGQGSG